MAGYKLVEDNSSYKEESLAWDKVVHSFEPEIDILPKADRDYFSSIVYNLINKEPALSNIPPKHMYIYKLQARRILRLLSYPMLVPDEYVRRQVADYLNSLKTRLSENGLAWLFGPLSHTTQHVTQEIKQSQPMLPQERS